jgi:2-keto-4-pentenoate hydratase
MDVQQKRALARELFHAWESNAAAPLPSQAGQPLTQAEAYEIQGLLAELHQQAGRSAAGWKLGLTSAALQERYGTDQPVYGRLLNGCCYPNGADIPAEAIPCPKIECELALVLKADLDVPPASPEEAMAAVDYAVPALELVGNRYGGYQAGLVDNIADNAFFGGFVLGDRPAPPDKLDLELLGVRLEQNGRTLGSGIGAAAMGGPAYGLLWLAKALAGAGTPLRAGEIILSGALLPSVPAQDGGYFRACFDGLGDVSVRF